MASSQLNQHAVGIFPTRQQTEDALQALQTAHYPAEQLSVVAKDAAGEDFAGIEGQELADQVTDADTHSTLAGVGGTILGVIEALGVSVTALALLPGAGQVVAVGTVAANALTPAVDGTVDPQSNLFKGLLGWGIPESRAQVYHDRVSKGDYLLMIEGTEAQIHQAESVLSTKAIQEWEVYEQRESLER